MLKMKGLTALTAHTLRPGGTYGDKGDIWGQWGIMGTVGIFTQFVLENTLDLHSNQQGEPGRVDHAHIGPHLIWKCSATSGDTIYILPKPCVRVYFSQTSRHSLKGFKSHSVLQNAWMRNRFLLFSKPF